MNKKGKGQARVGCIFVCTQMYMGHQWVGVHGSECVNEYISRFKTFDVLPFLNWGHRLWLTVYSIHLLLYCVGACVCLAVVLSTCLYVDMVHGDVSYLSVCHLSRFCSFYCEIHKNDHNNNTKCHMNDALHNMLHICRSPANLQAVKS